MDDQQVYKTVKCGVIEAIVLGMSWCWLQFWYNILMVRCVTWLSIANSTPKRKKRVLSTLDRRMPWCTRRKWMFVFFSKLDVIGAYLLENVAKKSSTKIHKIVFFTSSVRFLGYEMLLPHIHVCTCYGLGITEPNLTTCTVFLRGYFWH